MVKIERIEPTQLPNGLWLDGNEYASENVEESSGVLSLETGETDGYRVGPELDVGAISDVTNSKLEWTSSGDVEVLAAVSEVSARGSLSFDGVDDKATISPKIIQAHTSFTVEFYVKTTEVGGPGAYLVSQATEDSEGFVIRVRNSGIEVFISDKDRIDQGRIPGTIVVNDDTWHKVKVVYSYGSRLKLYIDDTVDFDESTTVEIDTYPDMTSIIGRDYVECNMSYLKLWGDDTESNLLAYYPLDDINSTVRDISGNNNDGTIIGAALDPDNPLLQVATNGQAIPGVSSGDNMTGKKLYTQQRLTRDTTGDPSPTLTELKATVEGAGGALPLINGGLIRSAHTQNNTMIR